MDLTALQTLISENAGAGVGGLYSVPPDPVHRIEQLETLLFKLPGEPMLGSTLDGFVAGILVCPVHIPPGEWLPYLLEADAGDDPATALALEQHGPAIVRGALAHYAATAQALQAGRYEPVYETDTRHNETLWEVWVEGFALAMALRPASWTLLDVGSEDVRAALAGLNALIKVAERTSRLSKSWVDEMTAFAPDLIPGWVSDLYGRPAGLRAALVPAARTSRKVGRNDPCPCGTGRKYKKCCGTN